MNHIVLLGDSIFDNADYVDEGQSVAEQLSRIAGVDSRVTLVAKDGACISDVFDQFTFLPVTASHVFLSCGGNDALRMLNVLDKPVASIGQALSYLHVIREQFKKEYIHLLNDVLHYNNRLSICTIYNQVPDFSDQALVALSFFNDVILEVAAIYGLPVVDLRVMCTRPSDFSTRSPIEPSADGSIKIATTICHVVKDHCYSAGRSILYG